MPPHDKQKINESIAEASRALRSYARKLDDKARFDDLISKVEALKAATRWADVELQFSDFFRQVGAGMIAAQEDLSRHSLSEISGPNRGVTPSVYRIPKVSAEMMFALKSTEGTKFNILLYGSEKEDLEQRQHKVSFEIVAAPPPPDVTALLSGIDISQFLLIDPQAREGVRDLIDQFVKTNEDSANEKVKNKAERARKFISKTGFLKVLILRTEDGWVAARFIPGSGDTKPNLDIVGISGGRASVPGPGGAEAGGLPVRLEPLASVFAAMAEEQARFLRRFS